MTVLDSLDSVAWRANIRKKYNTTNKNGFPSSLELLILAKMEKTKRRADNESDEMQSYSIN